MMGLKYSKAYKFFLNIQAFFKIQEVIYKLEFVPILIRAMLDIKN